MARVFTCVICHDKDMTDVIRVQMTGLLFAPLELSKSSKMARAFALAKVVTGFCTKPHFYAGKVRAHGVWFL